MSSIFIFPGQGSQTVGMGKELFDNHTAARAVFDEVDDALNQKLSKIIFEGPMEELTMTANVQPAIFTVSAAMLAVYAHENMDKGIIEPKYVAGHSLGEYSALYYAGAMTLADTAKLLRLRGDSMQRAVPVGTGAMAVVMGLSIDVLAAVCKDAESQIPGVCDIANDNAPGQIVISGSNTTILRAMELAKDAGAKRAMLLPLSVPPHSRLMAPVADDMREALSKIDMKSPSVPLISNKTCAPMTDVNEIKEALVYQITHGVRWRETVLALPALGITETVEIGPGSILTGLTDRIVPEMTARKLEI
ncbi:MAG: ACP S-malonyltransferase [Alphaproteobacteria bacterium]|nr:ACP S-malonyltransferase [Alphaproteobacteria bacterium]MCL2890069.1 ACP S-malonyltransferase [Alphaproteobacteria bacterium]